MLMGPRLKALRLPIALVLLGVLIGGYLFSDTRSRSILALHRCENCLHPNEVLGLIASVGIAKTPGLVPSVVLETDKTLAIAHPAPSARRHFVIIPKRDIKNVGEIGAEDEAYLVDSFAVMTELIREYDLSTYRLWSHGPGNQMVAYLHFHLAGK